MNVRVPPQSIVNQESGAKNVLANLSMTEEIDSTNSVCNEKYFFSTKVIHWLYSQNNVF